MLQRDMKITQIVVEQLTKVPDVPYSAQPGAYIVILIVPAMAIIIAGCMIL